MVLRGSAPGPFFQFTDGRPLTRDRFVAAVWTALRHESIDDSKYSGHSFRIGPATTATQQSIADSDINTWSVGEFSIHRLHSHPQRDLV